MHRSLVARMPFDGVTRQVGLFGALFTLFEVSLELQLNAYPRAKILTPNSTIGLTTLDQFSEIKATLSLFADKFAALEEKNKTMETTIDRQDAEIQRQDAEIQRQDAEIQRQDVEIQELKEMNDLWVHIRNRFFATYLRDFHHGRFESQNEVLILRKGDALAHFGEPVADARLFANGVRDDRDIYVELYGFQWEEVLVIRK